ncbi:hypothetical protein VNO77_44200 [Canavalia gladiata]|uniref:Uncharacterized protein n=1 Tax=Canavalia gladiata TaxID=3824 RepID=A0AAN9PQ58_CANGL
MIPRERAQDRSSPKSSFVAAAAKLESTVDSEPKCKAGRKYQILGDCIVNIIRACDLLLVPLVPGQILVYQFNPASLALSSQLTHDLKVKRNHIDSVNS